MSGQWRHYAPAEDLEIAAIVGRCCRSVFTTNGRNLASPTPQLW
jgi:hypothetical protein